MDGGGGFPSAAANKRIVMAEADLICLSRDKGKAFEVTVLNEAEFGIDIKSVVYCLEKAAKPSIRSGLVSCFSKKAFQV